jgi:transcriptional regulator
VLIHPWDLGAEDEWRGWLATRSVGTLVVPTDDLPAVVPTHFVWTGQHVLLHLARPNPALAALEVRPRAVFSVNGDWAYVPAAAKAIADEDPALGIPTSYYAAVNLRCTAELLSGEELLDVLRVQLAAFEAGSGVADPAVHRRRLPGITGIRLTPTEVEAKFKYGGNVDAEHRARVLEGLPAEAAAHLLRRTPPPGQTGS